MKFLSEVGHLEKIELAGDNEPVLAAGMRFCQKTRANRTHEKTRTSVAERFVQTLRGLQKTLISHVESAIQATIPAGHPTSQWAAMHSAWIYDRFQIHSSLGTTPYQSLFGRLYSGKIVCFGQTVFGLDPKADKYRPAWIRGAWWGKDAADMDSIIDGQIVIKIKTVRRIGEERDATLVLGVDTITSQTWEEAGLENPFSPASPVQSPTAMEFEQGGCVPMTPATDVHSDEKVEIPSSSIEHTAGGPLPGENADMDDDPLRMPKVKASGTEDNANQIAEIDMCHNDESMFPEDFEDDALEVDSEDECVAGHGEGDGPPNVSSEKLRELEEKAAFDEVEKL